MTTLTSRPLPDPSPSKSNPFARSSTQSSSFSRSTLLPTVGGPAKHSSQPPDTNVLSTPAEKLIGTRENGTGSGGKTRQSWRLLWRGGLEVGQDGWRLDGVTFFACLNLPPPTPSQPIANPFDAPIQANPQPPNGTTSSPFPSLPTGDADLCLSLESMRGRKYLQVRGLVDLPDDEILDKGNDAGVVQMSIAPTAPLLAAYFTGLLCRNPTLSSQGRTLSALVIGLGDECVDSPGSVILVYGQRSLSEDAQPSLRLCVARRKVSLPPPRVKTVRPGEPLPRAPRFFPAKAPRKPPPPFPLRSRSSSRSFSRAPSISSIYHPPPSTSTVTANLPLPPAPISGRTPGRRGEKRARPSGGDAGSGKEEERKRRAGRIVPSRFNESSYPPDTTNNLAGEKDERPLRDSPDEDIFGKRPMSSIASSIPKLSSDGQQGDIDGSSNGEPPSSSRSKRPKVPQQVLDSKAAIRKQTLLMLEDRGFGRDHEMFKDIFGMATKGTYFAFRHRLESSLVKSDIQAIVKGHLDMYLAPTQLKERDTLEGVVNLSMDHAHGSQDVEMVIDKTSVDGSVHEEVDIQVKDESD